MKVIVESKGLEIDAWLRDYVHTTVVFAIWHHASPIELARVRLDRGSHGSREPGVRCGIRVELPEGTSFASEATAPDLCTAVQQAADLLEVALHRPPSQGGRAARELLAA